MSEISSLDHKIGHNTVELHSCMHAGDARGKSTQSQCQIRSRLKKRHPLAFVMKRFTSGQVLTAHGSRLLNIATISYFNVELTFVVRVRTSLADAPAASAQ